MNLCSRLSCVRLTLVLVAVACTSAAGCSMNGHASGMLRAQSLRDDSAILPGAYTHAYFSHDALDSTSVLLSDIPLERLLEGNVKNGQVLHMELLWLPKAGETPMDAQAVNASIRHLVISNGEVGVYGGAGFVLPSANPRTHQKIGFTLRDASMSLQDGTAGFRDVLSPARITGAFTAERDDRRSRQISFAISQLVTNALGRTRYVLCEPPKDARPSTGSALVRR